MSELFICANHSVEWSVLYQDFKCPTCNQTFSIHQIFELSQYAKARAEQLEKQFQEQKEYALKACEIRTVLEKKLEEAEKLAVTLQEQLADLSEQFDRMKTRGFELKAELAAKDAELAEVKHKLIRTDTPRYAQLLGENENLRTEMAAKDARIKELSEDLCRLDPSYKL